jgi:hypothetical protein
MSEQVKRSQVKRFNHKADEAIEKSLKSKHLFSDRPEIYTTSLRCQLVGQEKVQEGQNVMLRSTGLEIQVISESSILIGRLAGSAAEVVKNAMTNDTRAESMMKAVVSRASGISPFCDIRCAELFPEAT